MTEKSLIGILLACCIALFFQCGNKRDAGEIHFTKADSLTDTYLWLQDSMLQAWNAMITDDNQKIDAMHNLLHELMVTGAADPDLLQSFETRITQLRKLRYTQKSMSNEHVVDEYDFASNALVSELITLAESQRQFAYNTTMQKLVDLIRLCDQRVDQYREDYDAITAQYNTFISQNKSFLKEVHSDSFMEVKPLFQYAEE